MTRNTTPTCSARYIRVRWKEHVPHDPLPEHSGKGTTIGRDKGSAAAQGVAGGTDRKVPGWGCSPSRRWWGTHPCVFLGIHATACSSRLHEPGFKKPPSSPGRHGHPGSGPGHSVGRAGKPRSEQPSCLRFQARVPPRAVHGPMPRRPSPGLLVCKTANRDTPSSSNSNAGSGGSGRQ